MVSSGHALLGCPIVSIAACAFLSLLALSGRFLRNPGAIPARAIPGPAVEPADDQRTSRWNRSGSAAAAQQEFPRIPRARSKKLPTGSALARFRAAILRLEFDG